MLRNTTFAVLALLAAAATAQATLIPTVEKRVNPGAATGDYAGFALGAFTTDTGMNAGAPASTWVSYALGLTLGGGEKISALEVTITSATDPTHGLAQRWNFNADTEVFDPTPSSTNVSNGDSHLIVNGSQIFVAPNETKQDVGTPPLPADNSTQDYGAGGIMNGLWGFDGTQQAAQTDGSVQRFAYIVVPRGSENQLVITVNAATSLGGSGKSFTTASFGTDQSPLGAAQFNPIPEPATLALLGLAAFGCLGLRRRS